MSRSTTAGKSFSLDRSRPVRERLLQFYENYTDVIFSRKWLRIYLFSGLKGLDINRWYVGVVRDKILTRIIKECRHRSRASIPEQAFRGRAGDGVGLPRRYLLLRRAPVHLRDARTSG